MRETNEGSEKSVREPQTAQLKSKFDSYNMDGISWVCQNFLKSEKRNPEKGENLVKGEEMAQPR